MHFFSDFRPQWSNKLSYVKESFPVRQMQSHQGPWTTINFPREEFSCKNLSWVKTRWSEAALEFVARFLILIFCTYSNNNDDLSLLKSYIFHFESNITQQTVILIRVSIVVVVVVFVVIFMNMTMNMTNDNNNTTMKFLKKYFFTLILLWTCL